MNKETENHFDNVAQNWDNNPVHQERTNAIAGEIKKIFSNNKYSSGLEYGAGTGLLSIALKDYFSEIVLMDNSKEMINVNTAKLISMGINHLKPSYYDLESNDYSEKKFDIIFMDNMMPEKDGIQATKELRELGFHMPVIAMTGNVSEEDRKIAADVGMDDYITKPVVIDAVKKILMKWFTE